MSIIYISDFDLGGSGYMNLSVELCKQLTGQGYDIIALGLGYNGQQHPYPFKIVPAKQLQDLPAMATQLKEQTDVEALVVALDIPLQEKMLETLNAPNETPYVGIFPMEAPPLCGPWAISMTRMDKRLVMSRFGLAAMEAQNLDGQFIPIGVDTESWRPPTLEERAALRQTLGVDDDTFVILTVADNQERKNLSRTLEIFAGFAEGRKAQHWLVTRPESPVGWSLEDYAMDLGIMDRLMIWRRGMPFKQLWTLYAAADCMLLTSKAEGLALPVLEAMSCRLPVVGTKCAAIEEHLIDDRGLLIEPDYVMVDPFGNGRRYMAGRDAGVYALKLLRNGMSQADIQGMLDRAHNYVKNRTFEHAAAVLEVAIKEAIAEKAPG